MRRTNVFWRPSFIFQTTKTTLLSAPTSSPGTMPGERIPRVPNIGSTFRPRPSQRWLRKTTCSLWPDDQVEKWLSLSLRQGAQLLPSYCGFSVSTASSVASSFVSCRTKRHLSALAPDLSSNSLELKRHSRNPVTCYPRYSGDSEVNSHPLGTSRCSPAKRPRRSRWRTIPTAR